MVCGPAAGAWQVWVCACAGPEWGRHVGPLVENSVETALPYPQVSAFVGT